MRSRKSDRRPLTLFAEDGGRYHLCPAALNSYRWARRAEGAEDPPAVPDTAYVSALRGRLDPRRLRDCGHEGGVDEVDDAAIGAAATGGIVANAAFLDVVDDLLVRAPCLCCYFTRSRSRAADAEEQIRTLLGYYSQTSYESSTAFYRVLCALLRDVSAPEAAMIVHHTSQGPRDRRAEEASPAEATAREGVAVLNRVRGVCAVYVTHAPGTVRDRLGGARTEPGVLAREGVALCIYSTPEGRKLLRRLGKACKVAGLTLTTRVATGGSYDFFCLRHKYRLYTLECHSAGPAGARPPYDIFWDCAAGAAARRR